MAQLGVEETIELLKTALTKAWERQEQNFLLELIERLRALGPDSPIAEREVREVESLVRHYFGEGLAEVARRPVVQMVINSYLTGKQAIRADFYLDLKDENAIKVLENYSLFWVKDYYDRFVAERIKGVLGEYFERGLTRRELAERLHEELGERIREERDVYFEVLADHLSNKIHNLGRVSGYEEAGIEYVKVVAVLDERTTRICRRMHGRVIPVKYLVRQRDRILRAARRGSIEAMRRAQPMITEDEWKRRYERLYTTRELIRNGLGLPPYHFRCRTRTIAYFETRRERDIGEKLKRGRGIIRELSGPEVVEWMERTRELAERGKLVFRGKRLLRRYFEKLIRKHARETGVQSEEEYLRSAMRTIRRAEEVYVFEYTHRAVRQPQMVFYDGNFVTVVDRDYFVRTHFPPSAGTLEGYKNRGIKL